MLTSRPLTAATHLSFGLCSAAPFHCLQVAQLRREAAKLRELTAQRDSLAEERQQLQSSLAAAVQRAERAEAEVATLRVRSGEGD